MIGLKLKQQTLKETKIRFEPTKQLARGDSAQNQGNIKRDSFDYYSH